MNRSRSDFVLVLSVPLLFFTTQLAWAQDASANSKWSSTSEQSDPDGSFNSIRTHEVHSETNGHTVDRQSMEKLGPDGQYVPYGDTETETVHVDANTVRTIQRTYGRGPEGERTLLQVSQEETHTLPGGNERTVRTQSNPDVNGNLQVARRETEESKEVSAGVRDIRTTVLTPDVNGGLTATVRSEERRTQQPDGTENFKKSTSLADGNGGWQLSEVREGARKIENCKEVGKDERVLRPDSTGNLAIVERTTTHLGTTPAGDKREITDKYSVTIPGASPDGTLKLVQRDTTVERQSSTSGAKTTFHQTEQVNPASPSEGVHPTGETIDRVRVDSNGIARQTRTTIHLDSNGSTGAVWVDVGKTDNPAVLKVDTSSPPAPAK